MPHLPVACMDTISGEFLVTLTSINAFVATPNAMEMLPQWLLLRRLYRALPPFGVRREPFWREPSGDVGLPTPFNPSNPSGVGTARCVCEVAEPILIPSTGTSSPTLTRTNVLHELPSSISFFLRRCKKKP
ncbi:hypothetical protein B296_00051111 [Ensete ventricosum]|uniref:Uncharacterized protein n=1 Tax=Ensete ventricosum TaxID=4639 RepID=A0A426Y5Y1_ENSVE|nr:hypothetical protein B296_00051111 [Ensete ventricosum]